MAKRVLPAAAVGVFMLLLIVRPDYFLNSAARGLLLFASSVLPAIFPFFFCSSLLTAMGAANSLSRLGARPVGVLFNSPPAGAYVLALSMLSGYPIGAATLSDLFRRGIVDAEEVKRIASFTSTSGPIFILGTVGSAVFGDPAAGAVILAAHYLAALTTGLVFRGRRKASGTSPVRVAAADADSALQQSIASSTLAMLAVGGYIVVGNMLIDALALQRRGGDDERHDVRRTHTLKVALTRRRFRHRLLRRALSTHAKSRLSRTVRHAFPISSCAQVRAIGCGLRLRCVVFTNFFHALLT